MLVFGASLRDRRNCAAARADRYGAHSLRGREIGWLRCARISGRSGRSNATFLSTPLRGSLRVAGPKNLLQLLTVHACRLAGSASAAAHAAGTGSHKGEPSPDSHPVNLYYDEIGWLAKEGLIHGAKRRINGVSA